MKSKNNNIVGLISTIIVFIILFGAIGLVFKFTDGLNEDFKSFYLEHNGELIVSSESKMRLDANQEYRFDCKYLYNPDNEYSYNVKIIPNNKADFQFVVGYEVKKWSEEKDLTSCFKIDKKDGYFTLSIPSDFSINKVFNSLYPNSEIEFLDVLYNDLNYYTLCISNFNEKINYLINFDVNETNNYNVTLNLNSALQDSPTVAGDYVTFTQSIIVLNNTVKKCYLTFTVNDDYVFYNYVLTEVDSSLLTFDINDNRIFITLNENIKLTSNITGKLTLLVNSRI